jgi:hypothetical protein
VPEFYVPGACDDGGGVGEGAGEVITNYGFLIDDLETNRLEFGIG